MLTYTLTRKETCPDCKGTGKTRTCRYVCMACNFYLTPALPDDREPIEIQCLLCRAKGTLTYHEHICLRCNQKGAITSEVDIKEALQPFLDLQQIESRVLTRANSS